MNTKLRENSIIILLILLVVSFTNILLATYRGLNIDLSNKIGFWALTLATSLSWKKPDKAFVIAIITLSLGVFNLLNFALFLDGESTFSFLGLELKGVKMYPIVFIVVLFILNKRKKNGPVDKEKVKDEKQKEYLLEKEHFMSKFKDLSDEELELRLKENLVSVAIEALKEIKENRSIK